MRIGNGAADQLQLDIYGEAMDSIHFADSRGLGSAHEGWTALDRLTDWVCEHWDQPEEGIWETRGGRQDFTYGRFKCWVALDRVIRLATDTRPARQRQPLDGRTRHDLPADHGPRAGTRTSVRFVQHYDTDVLDASLLLMPLVGFVTPTTRCGCPPWTRWTPNWSPTAWSTDTTRAPPRTGCAGHEGTFSLCTFWYVDALARSGRLDEAQLTFEKMLTYANHLGLYSEEIGLTGEQLGNFPQAFTHLALINAAINLDYQLDHGAGNVEPVLARA